MISPPSSASLVYQTKTKNIKWVSVGKAIDIEDKFKALLVCQNIAFAEFDLLEKFTYNTTTQYICVSADSNPILLFPIQEVWIDKSHFPSFKRTFWQRITSLLIDLSCFNVLFSGNLLQIDKSYLGYDGNVISEIEAYQLHFQVINSMAVQKSISGHLVHLPARIAENFKSDLRTWGFEQPLPDYEMALEIRSHWKNWADYTADLSKKYVARAKKIRDSASELSIRMLSESEILDLEAEIQFLYLQTINKQDVVLAKAAKGYFNALKTCFKDDFQIKGMFKNAKLVAFYSWFAFDDTIEMHFVGLEYNLNHQYNLYFNILFGGLIDAIELNKKSIFFGRTSLDAKASLGAKAIPSHSYLRLKGINPFVTETLQKYISKAEIETWKDRNPLKNLA
ncbi:MAG: hypothetical protein ACKVOU_06520 [Cytophagales bacterium]